MTQSINENMLEVLLSKVEQVRSWSPRVMSKLENFIRSAEDDELFRVNPIEWAESKGVAEPEAIDLFLHSAKTVLFNMDWIVICPCCGMIMHSLSHLHNMQPRHTCTICTRDDIATLDNYVQVVFTLPPAVRELRYHHPESLAMDDYLFKYVLSRNARYFVGGTNMTFSQMFPLMSKHFGTVSRGDRVTVETKLGPMGVLVTNRLADLSGVVLIGLGDETATEPQKVVFRLTASGFETDLPMIDPNKIIYGQVVLRGALYAVKPGPITLEIEQASSGDEGLFVWQSEVPSPDKFDPEMVNFTPSLTAKRLFACQTFHDLFRSEVFQESQGFSVKDVTILFTDLKSSTQLYNQIGDLNAFALVREHYGVLNKAILNNHGAVVKTIGDAIMATFNQPQDAVSAGLDMLDGLREMNAASQHGDLELKVGIHRGAAISVTLNERIDYFGQTINTAARVQGSAGGGEIYITSDIYAEPDVPALLSQHPLEVAPMQIELKGIEEPVKVYRITGANRAV